LKNDKYLNPIIIYNYSVMYSPSSQSSITSIVVSCKNDKSFTFFAVLWPVIHDDT